MRANQAVANIKVRPAQERGFADHGWLKSFHTFSFADYYDSRYMGFRTLRVINEDRVALSKGFGSHPHQNMEILSYVIDGELKHRDSMGHESIIKPGQVQKVTAGLGIVHSEFNASNKKDVHFLQIWIVPKENGLKPSYQQYSLPMPDPKKPLLLIGSPEGGKNVVQFYQDIFVLRGDLGAQQACQYPISAGRGVWLQMVKGQLWLNDQMLKTSDGAAIENVKEISLKANENSEFLLFDMK